MKFKRVFVQGHKGSPCLDPHLRGLCSGIWHCLFPQGRNPWCQGDAPSRTHGPFRRTQIAPSMLLRFAQASDFLGELCQWCMMNESLGVDGIQKCELGSPHIHMHQAYEQIQGCGKEAVCGSTLLTLPSQNSTKSGNCKSKSLPSRSL